MLLPATLVCAFSAKRPKPPLGRVHEAAQRSVSRSEVGVGGERAFHLAACGLWLM